MLVTNLAFIASIEVDSENGGNDIGLEDFDHILDFVSSLQQLIFFTHFLEPTEDNREACHRLVSSIVDSQKGGNDTVLEDFDHILHQRYKARRF